MRLLPEPTSEALQGEGGPAWSACVGREAAGGRVGGNCGRVGEVTRRKERKVGSSKCETSQGGRKERKERIEKKILFF